MTGRTRRARPVIADAVENETRGPVSGAQSVDRALSVMSCFASRNQDWGIAELSRALELSPSTVHRIVRALVSRGFLEQNKETERYVLGRMILVLGEIAHHDFGVDLAWPILKKLGGDLGESVNLGVRDDRTMVVLLHVESPHALRYDHGPGSSVPIHASAMGKAVLAFSGDPIAEVGALGSLTGYSPNTLSSKAALLADLEKTRDRGYSFDDAESTEGVRCVGAPIVDEAGSVRAAFAVQAPFVRMSDDRVAEIGEHMKGVAGQLAEAMRWQIRG
jgi:IclR family acetate operon transcriptional repressor